MTSKPLFLYHPRCGTCKKARAWLDAQGIEYREQDLTATAPTAEQLSEWKEKASAAISKMFNTSGMQYRSLGLKDKVKSAPESELLALLSTDGMLVKRPIIVTPTAARFGFKENEWAELLLDRDREGI